MKNIKKLSTQCQKRIKYKNLAGSFLKKVKQIIYIPDNMKSDIEFKRKFKNRKVYKLLLGFIHAWLVLIYLFRMCIKQEVPTIIINLKRKP